MAWAPACLGVLPCARTARQDPGTYPECAVPRAGACAPYAQRRQRLPYRHTHSAWRARTASACTARRAPPRLPQAGARAACRRPTASTPRAACTCWPDMRLPQAGARSAQATNGLDPTRRLHVLGYCRCVASLSEVVEAAVLDRGGEVFRQDLRVQRRARGAAAAACWVG